jgi:glutathione S-transferase
VKVIGSFVSPYVRKVLACLNLKRLAYEVDPITPFFGDDEFARLSPLRRIPVLIDNDVTITDSSVICAYLDEAYAGHPLLPKSAAERAQARWLEEYADTRLGDLLIWGLFYQRVVRPAVWNEDADEERVERTLTEGLPSALDYLERQLPAEGFLFGDIGLADISVATFFRNGAYAGFEVDPKRWPRVAGFVQRTLAHHAIASLLAFEDVQRSAEIRHRRKALLEAGAPLTEGTLGVREPRRGYMRL